MIFSNSKRLQPEDAKNYYDNVLAAQLPSERAMKNDGEETILSCKLSPETKTRLNSNILHTLALTIS